MCREIRLRSRSEAPSSPSDEPLDCSWSTDVKMFELLPLALLKCSGVAQDGGVLVKRAEEREQPARASRTECER